MIKLYDYPLSGNCHKVRLLLSSLGIEYELVHVDLLQGEHKTPEFLKLNPLGQIPVIVDGEIVLRDAQAILVYLAQRYGGEDWLPSEPAEMGQVMQWLSISANEIQNSIAKARLYYLFNLKVDIESLQNKSYQLLKIFDQHLSEHNWLVQDRPTIADIACFPYIALAPEGQISLAEYPNVEAWIKRIQELPGYVSMPKALSVV